MLTVCLYQTLLLLFQTGDLRIKFETAGLTSYSPLGPAAEVSWILSSVNVFCISCTYLR